MWPHILEATQWLVALATLIGVFLAVRQLHYQAASSTVQVLMMVDERWADRMSYPRQQLAEDAGLQLEGKREYTLKELLPGCFDYAVEIGGKEFEEVAATKVTLPDLFRCVSPPIEAARDEQQYKEMLVRRARSTFETLERVERDAKSRKEAQQLLTELKVISKAYVNLMNDIADLVEQRCLDPVMFFGKRHYLIIEEVFLLEPFIIWLNKSDDQRRWGLRVLAFGEASRDYHWRNPIHSVSNVEVGDPPAERVILARRKVHPRLVLPDRLRKMLYNRRGRNVFSERNKVRQTQFLNRIFS